MKTFLNTRLIDYDSTVPLLSWTETVEALRAGHLLPKAGIEDMFLGPSTGTLLSRGAWISGLGYGVKSVSVFDENPAHGLPTIQGAMLLFDSLHGSLEAIIDATLVTEFKTAADSVLGASYLARPNSKRLLIVGAGTVARSLVRAYPAVLPELEEVFIWSRRKEQSIALARELESSPFAITPVSDLAKAASGSDIVSSCTLARDPLIRGEWIESGTHIDLIGAYKKDMREADDTLIVNGSLFVDSRETTLGHIGELDIPIANGVLTPNDIKGDLYDLVQGKVSGRTTDEEITIFKNGGGAHLDLMIARYISEKSVQGYCEE